MDLEESAAGRRDDALAMPATRDIVNGVLLRDSEVLLARRVTASPTTMVTTPYSATIAQSRAFNAMSCLVRRDALNLSSDLVIWRSGGLPDALKP